MRTLISLLTEISDRWAEALHQWSNLNQHSWGNRTSDRHAEHLLSQTMIGAWPIEQERCWRIYVDGEPGGEDSHFMA